MAKGKKHGNKSKSRSKGLGKEARARLQSPTISYRHPDAPWKGFSATRGPCIGCGRLDKAKKWCRRCQQYGPMPHEERVERWQQAQAAIEDFGGLGGAQRRADPWSLDFDPRLAHLHGPRRPKTAP